MEELDPIRLKEELDQFKKEKEKIRNLMGQIGGKHAQKQDRNINIGFIAAIALIASNDLLHHLFGIHTPIPSLLSLEIAVLLVSIKIIWMMHKSTKVEHFQFWILNSIEVASVFKPVRSQFKLCRIGSGSLGFLPPPGEEGKITPPT